MPSELESSRPLGGRRVISTRAERQGVDLAFELERQGASVISLPLIQILPASNLVPLDAALAEIPNFDWLVFTSTNAVEFFLLRFDQLEFDRGALKSLQIAAVGPNTRRSVEREGLSVALEPSHGAATELARLLIESVPSIKAMAATRVLLPTSNIGRDTIEADLAARGFEVTRVTVYRNEAPDISKRDCVETLTSTGVTDIIFASPSAIVNLTRMLEEADLSDMLRGIRVICIGETTAQEARKAGLSGIIIPQIPTSQGIVQALVESID